MSVNFDFKKLEQGDIFFYSGSGIISNIIKQLDGGEFSHASIYIGDNNVVEALSGGVMKKSIEESIKDSEYIKVFRLKDKVLKEKILDMNLVINTAKYFYKNEHKYGYVDIES